MHSLPPHNSPHFTLQPLAEGVFAALACDGGAAISNAGLLDLGDQVLVFDTFLTPQAALDLRAASQTLLGRHPTLVVNSHYHNDHIWGNQVFLPEAQILSSARTRELIASDGVEEYEWYSANSAGRLASLRADYDALPAGPQRDQLNLWIGYYQGLVDAFPQLQLCMPGVTFSTSLSFHGPKRTAELITFEGAHTGSDTVLFLPAERILFMSDLLFVNCHPYLGDGDPLRLLETLRELSKLDASMLVPGHGPVGGHADLQAMIEYIDGCFETARLLVEQGDVSEARIAALQVEPKYENWQLSRFYPANIEFLCELLAPTDQAD